MNNAARRFLALNCVLQGHSILDAFDGQVELLQNAFNFNKLDKAQAFVDEVDSLKDKPSYLSNLSPLILPLVNFFRSQDYAFVFFPGMQPIFLNTFAISDRNGEVDAQVRNVVLQSLIRDIAYVPADKDIAIVDGKFLIPRAREGELQQAIQEAYVLYCLGPCVKNAALDSLHKVRDRLTLEDYRPIPVATMLNLFKDMVAFGFSGTDYTRTTLVIPDYLPVYQKTGTVMELNHSDEGILWLLDVSGEDKCKSFPVSHTVVRELLVTGLTDLANLDYVLGGPNGGLHVRA